MDALGKCSLISFWINGSLSSLLISRYNSPSIPSNSSLALKSSSVNCPKIASVPSLRMTLSSRVCSRVEPYTIEVVPQELLPTIPPIIARFAVEVMGLKNSPCGFKNLFSSSLTTPGWTRTQPSSLLNSNIWVKYFETSTTTPSPTHWPASDVPAVLGIRDVLCSLANRISFLISSSDLNNATARGNSL